MFLEYKKVYIWALCVFIFPYFSGGTQQSTWSFHTAQSPIPQTTIHPNYMFKDSFVAVTVECAAAPDATLTFDWILQQVDCMEQMYDTSVEVQSWQTVVMAEESDSPFYHLKPLPSNNTKTRSLTYRNSKFKRVVQKQLCQAHSIITLMDNSTSPYTIAKIPNEIPEPHLSDLHLTTVEMKPEQLSQPIARRVVKAWETGMYHFILTISSNQKFEAQVYIEMHSHYGYLSAIDWPLLPFNAVLAFIYLILATAWMLIWARSHKHSRRVHVAMGVIATAGAMSHTLQFVQFATINSKGVGVMTIVWFAHILNILQMALVSMLLMVVSLGYGITRPSISRKLMYTVVCLASIQFLSDLAWQISVEKSLRLEYLYPTLVKVVLWLRGACMVVVAGWIMICSILTFIHLLRRQHSTQMRVFTLLMVGLVIAFLAQLVMFGVSMGWMTSCRTFWQLEWLFSSFSNMCYFVLLIILMWLWRPIDIAQSYAFAPLASVDDEAMDDEIDEDEDDEDDGTGEQDKIKLEPL